MEQKGLQVRLEIVLENKLGLLKELTDIIYKMNLSIEEFSTHKSGINIVTSMTLESQEEDYFLFERLLEKIKFTIGEFVSANLIDIH